MWHRPSLWVIAALVAPVALATPRGAAGVVTPIQLARNTSVPFTGASLAVVEIDGIGGPDLIGRDAANAVVALNHGAGSFGSPLAVAMGAATLKALRVVDLDGDGRNDLVGVSAAPAMVVRHNGAGMSFGPIESTPLPGGPNGWSGLALGDLDGDGRPDAVGSIHDSTAIAILMNDGLGHLGAPTLHSLGGRSYAHPLIGDFNGDGHADIVVAVYEPQRGLTLLAGHGDGTFDPPIAAVLMSRYFLSLTAADLDADGDLDIGASGEDEVAVFENPGDGQFAAPRALQPGYQEYFFPRGRSIGVGDFDRDGRPDLVVAAQSQLGHAQANNYLAIFPNRGGLAFDSALQYRVGGGPEDAVLADIDADGWPDGIASCRGNDEEGYGAESLPLSAVFILRNVGPPGLNGLLEVYDPVWLPARPAAGAVPDLYGSYEGLMHRARNRGHGIFASSEVIGWGEPRLARDLDADGDDDLLVASHDSLWVLLHAGDFGLGPPMSVVTGLTFLDFADVNGDGRLDMLASDAAHEVLLLAGDGAGHFGPSAGTGATRPANSGYAWPGAARDVNGDGRADILFSVDGPGGYVGGGGTERFRYQHWLVVRLNDGAGGFAAPETTVAEFAAEFPKAAGGGPLRFGDWNGDGNLDVACAAASCRTDSGTWFAAFHGHGDGSFSALAGFEGGTSMCDMAAADLNLDGLDDLVRINSNVGYTFAATTLASDGLGGFAGEGFQMGELPFALFVADLDGDRLPDVITRNNKLNYGGNFSYSVRRNVTVGDLPTPALASLVSARVEDGVVRLDWFAAGAAYTGTIERRTAATGWSALAVRGSDGAGHLRYADPEVEAGESYGYRLRIADPDGARLTEAAWVSVPGLMFALRGALPNPAASSPTIAFTLPSAGDAELQLLDVAGRSVRRERLAGLGAGPHRAVLAGTTLEPGYYVVRLSFGGRKLQRSLVVTR